MSNTPIHRCLRSVKRMLQFARGRDCFFRTDVHLVSTRFGSEYGGWNVPDGIISSDSIIYSGGIGTDITFDLMLIQSFGCTVHAFDPTPKCIEWLKTLELPDKFHYYDWGIADYDGTADFHIPKNPNHISHSMVDSQVTRFESVKVSVLRIVTIMQKLNHAKIDLLKIDIEGAEYSVIEDLLRSNIRPKLLLLEFHHRFNGIGVQKTRQSVKAIRDAGYQIYFVSPSGEELCFILED